MPSNNIKYPEGCKAVSTNTKNTELLKRLKILSKALKGEITNEEANTPNRYKDLILHLTDSQFLNNKNSDVQLLLACCIADLFRVFAPNSPIENLSLLKDVLLFMTTVIGNIRNNKSSMYQYYLYLLENISVVETMQISLELGDNAYVILRQLIKQSLNRINEGNADEHIQGMLVGMCSKLIQGVDQISNIILDAIFFFIVQPQKINNREAYFMARDLIRTNQTTLDPYVSLLLKRGLETGILDECELISQKKLYDLICELHKFAPEMISSILPILVNQMHNDDVVVRREAVRLFGNLFGGRNSRMAEDEPEAWNEYMKRFADVNEEIRRICIRNAEDILIFHPELRGQVTDAVILRCQDVDENVRLEVLTMMQGLAKRKFEALSERLLTHVIDRIRDKKIRVRHAAIRGLSHLHRTVFSNDELTDLERSSVSSIFSAIMNHYYQPLLEDRLLTEKIFVSNLIPYKLDESKRMGVLINIFLNTNNYGAKALEQILMKQSFQRRLLRNLVKLIEHSTEPQKGKTVDDIIRGIVECNPEPAKFSLIFRQFMTHLTNDKQILSLLKYITGKEYTCQKIESAVLEILQRLRDHKVSVECIDAMRCLFECCSPLQFDGTAVSVLVKMVITLIKDKVDGNQFNQCYKLIKLLKIVADAYPHCFVNAPTLESLIELIENESFSETETLLSLVIAISNELKQHELLAKDMVAKYVKYCECISLNGTPRAAKYAVRCISRLLKTEQARAKLGNIFQNSLLHVSTTDPQCCTALKALSSCIEVDALQFCNKLFEILKKHCLKFVANFLVSVAQFSECDVEPLAKNLLKLYSTLLKTRGDIFEKPCSSTHMAEFRILAGNSMLKLATKPRYAKFVTADDLITLSALGYDEETEIRHRFFDANITKRRKYLERSEMKEFAPYYQPEYCIAYAIYVLARLPLFESVKFAPELRRLTESIWFLLEIFSARKEPGSLEFIYNMFKTIKNSTDSKLQGCTKEELQQKNEKIWALCDIGILLMSYRVKNLMKDVESKPLLSKRFFFNMGRANTKIYVPLSFVKEMKTKKTNTKHLKTDTTKGATKSSMRQSLTYNSKQSKRMSNAKITVKSKRSVNERHIQNNSNQKVQTNDEIDEVDVKRPKLVLEEKKPQQIKDKRKMNEKKSALEKKFSTNSINNWGLEKEASPVSSTSMKDRKEVEKLAPLKNLFDESKPGTLNANISEEHAQNFHGSLEDCDYSPIPPFYIKNIVAAHQPSFTSSTPIITAKRNRTIGTTSENLDIRFKVERNGQMIATKKVGEDPKSNGKCNKIKLSSVRRIKLSDEKVRAKMTPAMDGIATRLRSRQTTISPFTQVANAESSKK
ncbi:Sister chromatid cohesion protein [Dirofilaria immitis]